jgi:carbon storage regulator CsrA
MLVLSRRQNDKVVFPNLGITVQVVRVDGKTVRLGIEAPRDVPVLRHEIADQWNEWRDYPVGHRPSKLSHALRNRLNAAAVGLQLLHRQLESGELEEAEPTIFKIFRELGSMEKEVAGVKELQTVAPATPPRRALLVEDNDNESELLAGYLRTCDFEVSVVRDGADALEYLACQDKNPDVVLLDMNMPRMDGKTTLYEMRSNPANAHLKIFAVTGMSQDEAGIGTGRWGVDGWFIKPIRPDVLVSEIHRELAELASSA